VPLVEEGWWDHPVTRLVAREYLRPLKGVRALILGCTHYPLIKPLIRATLGPRVTLIDSGVETARVVQESLRRRGLCREGARKGGEEFFVTDGPAKFQELARRILGGGTPRARVARLPL
jgi:glutamate racemase